MNLEKYKNNIGIERLKFHYSQQADFDEDFLITRYILNIKISQALYPILSIIEVYLRNAIDIMLQNIVDKDWLEKEITNQNLLFDYDYTKLNEALKTLKKKYKSENITRGKIIAELNFGFWVNLCSRKYNPKIWTKKNAFKMVFPNFPNCQKEDIAIISSQLTKIKNLRNRVFHYEPILKNNNDFLTIYNEIRQIIFYLPSGNERIIRETDNFNRIITEVIKELQQELERLENKKP